MNTKLIYEQNEEMTKTFIAWIQVIQSLFDDDTSEIGALIEASKLNIFVAYKIDIT
jgi:hypothetical protein